jgi:hypothetical protein
MFTQRLWLSFCIWVVCLWLTIALWGCSGVMPAALPATAPLFEPTSEDAEHLVKIAHDLDTQALHCMEAGNCEQVSYARGLVSLFGNQEAARASFRQVIDRNPGSPLATTSQRWLRLIEDDGTLTSPSPWTDIVLEFVREWMERQVTADKPAALMATEDTLVEQTLVVHGVVQVLDKQLRERDREIAVLRSQLEALKLIDEDHSNRQRRMRPPTSLVPTAATHQ